jgi:hypothetical protein
MWLRSKGKRDGKIGLPKQDKDGKWLSPKIACEQAAYQQRASEIWQKVESDTAPLRTEHLSLIESGKPSQLVMLQDKIRYYRENSDHYVRRQGEDALDESAIRTRRIKERGLRAENSIHAEIEQLAAEIMADECRAQELAVKIANEENLAHLRADKAENVSRARITAYWDGVLQTHPDKQIPPTPKFTQISSEESYLRLHRPNCALLSESKLNGEAT